jgi:hypothetical protein
MRMQRLPAEFPNLYLSHALRSGYATTDIGSDVAERLNRLTIGRIAPANHELSQTRTKYSLFQF